MSQSVTEPETTASAPDPVPVRPQSRTGRAWQRVVTWLRSERLLWSVLIASFLLRLFLADRNSYWLDELYSLTIHGRWNESAIELVRVLAETGVYPPIYFVTLFEWVSWFGDSELSTRLLSNIYITLAGLFLYLALRLVFVRRIALTSVIAFNLMYTPMYYGLETRPYAQTMFTVTLSSYLLLRLYRDATKVGWLHALVSPVGSLFVIVNSAVLLTHLYNVFFWAAQALIAAIFVLCELRTRTWLRGMVVILVLYGFQAAIFVGVWGRAVLRGFDQLGGSFSIEGADDLRNPLSVVLNSVVRLNLEAPGPIEWMGLLLGLVLLVGAVATISRRAVFQDARLRAWTTFYLIAWLLLPLVTMYLAFLATGVARYSNRLFVFSAVPLAPLVVLSIEEVARGISRLSDKVASIRRESRHRSLAIVMSAAVIGLLILPGAFEAMRGPKSDWRGTAQEIVSIIESNPEASYIVYETSFRDAPILNYYLARYSDEVRVAGTIRRSEERREDFGFETDTELIKKHDYLIVPFIHHATSSFPVALERLQDLYGVHHWEIGDNRRGIVIFSTSGESEQGEVVP